MKKILIIFLILILLVSCYQKDLHCIMTVEVKYLNAKTDTLQIPGRRVALANDGCIIYEGDNVACFVTSFKVLSTDCK